MPIESVLLAVTQVKSFINQQFLGNATGFYFQRADRLFLITNRHVVFDSSGNDSPDRLEILLHPDPDDFAKADVFSIPLFNAGQTPLWREAQDSGNVADVVAIALDASRFSEGVTYTAFTPEHLPSSLEQIEVGESVRAIGFPLGFQDDLHHLPVMRHAIVASSFNLRFEGHGYFLTDSLMHRGSSGSPIVLRSKRVVSGRNNFPWILLGIHSARLDSETRDTEQDERLNLFVAWYSDVLNTLTK